MNYNLFSLFLLIWTGAARRSCLKNLPIHTFADSIDKTDSSPSYTYDDGTTSNFTNSAADGKIQFTVNDVGGYVFTDFPCKKLMTHGYNALNFALKGPVGTSLTVELQTSSSCRTKRYTSYFTTITIVTDQTWTYSIPLSSFKGANIDAVQSFVFQDFATGDWEIGETEFVCSNNPETHLSIPDSKTSSGTNSLTQNIIARDISATCSPHLIDDFASQSRLTFLFYNANLFPSSDDATMKPITGRVDTQTSVIVSNNHLTLTPKDTNSYWFSQLGCFKATNQFGGIGLTIKAQPRTTIRVELGSDPTCSNVNPKNVVVFSSDLGWTFDGTEKYYQIPFSKFPGIDTDHLVTILFSGLNNPVSFGPIAMYCGATGAAYPYPEVQEPAIPINTISPTTGTSDLVIDTFGNRDTNSLGFYHGGDESGTYQISRSQLTINMKSNADLAWYTQLANGCKDLRPLQDGYLHISYSGSNAFTIILQQHNPTCNDKIQPTPFTWDGVEASRYSNTEKTDIYVPLTHFDIDRSKSIGLGLKGFYTDKTTTISKIEIVKTVPRNFLVPSKLPAAPLVQACTRPNSFAFAIDDGEPKYAQRVVSTIARAGIKVTFFTVGAALRDPSTNLTGVYKGMISAGHQVAYHSFTHPPMEGLPSLSAIDWELNQDMQAVQETLGITSTYFRPPFGTEGARVRQRLQSLIPGSKFIMWSVDVQDYLWASGPTPEKQLSNFQSDVDKGGNLVVMHYLYESTVNYLPRFIAIAKATGKQLMRVDQCLEDPNAPPL